jgi:hypothetical protein
MHIVIQVVDNPNREENNDEDNGNSRNEHAQIPKRPFFVPDIDKKDELNKRLNKGKNKNDACSHFRIKAKKFRLNNNKVSCKR